MARTLGPSDLLTGSGMSGSSLMANTDTITSNPMRLDSTTGFSLQVAWTGTPNGAFKLQCSNDDGGDQAGGGVTIGNWTDVAGSSSAVSGAAGNQMWEVASAMYRWARLSYTNTSSTGTVTSVLAFHKSPG